MTRNRTASAVLALATTAIAPALGNADDTKTQPPDVTAAKPMDAQAKDKTQPKAVDKDKGKTIAMSDTEATEPKLDTSQVMKITQQAMVHIGAALTALDSGNVKAAKTALGKSEKDLARLYETPALATVMSQLDEAIGAMSGDEKPPGKMKAEGKMEKMEKKADLAPLFATVSSLQAYLDPEVVAQVKEAQTKAESGEREASANALRLARDRIAIDIAFVPVEEAYTRVLAAQQALQRNDRKKAVRILRDVPIVIGQVQMSRPLVPIRFKLQAAAVAADAGKFDRSKALLEEVNQDVQRLEQVAKDTALGDEIAPIVSDLEQIRQRVQGGENPVPNKLREIAKRTRSIGRTDQG